MKTEFVSIVSHELRTPLTTIKGFTDMVLEGDAGEINEEQREFLTIVKQDSDRLVALVNDLLDISRIESGRIDLDIKALDLGSVVRDVVRTLKPSIDEKGQTLQVDIDPELSPIMGDSDRLHQVVTNLLSNAYKYTPDSGSLTIKVAKEGDLAKVSVSDTGVGISKEDQERLFTRFFRADSSLTRDVGGTGLGLTIVKSLVEMHGGTVSVVSEPGIGSTFSFTIPIGVSLAKEVAPRLDEAISEAALATSGRRILVVEDEPAIAKLLQHYLEQSGYRVEIAGNAEEALARIDAYPPDLITLDIKLPGQDGMELVEKLDQDPIMAKIPILIVSVLEYDESSIHHGLVDSLLKPIDGGQLIGTVGRMLAESKSEKVLIIDDDPGVRTFLIKALMKKGYEALGAGDGESGLVIAERDHPGLILLDLRLPGMDGFAVLKKLKSNPKTARLPVIAMSGSESFKTGARARLLTLGAVDFITKPFNMETLLEEIKTLMQGGVE
jgi:DNA-binding response OmpR family regulator/two-component sensor histidine kinase